jgi:hypothetical protein
MSFFLVNRIHRRMFSSSIVLFSLGHVNTIYFNTHARVCSNINQHVALQPQCSLRLDGYMDTYPLKPSNYRDQHGLGNVTLLHTNAHEFCEEGREEHETKQASRKIQIHIFPHALPCSRDCSTNAG